MKKKKSILKISRTLSMAMCFLLLFTMMPSWAWAADTEYTCTINPCYSHPVTGAIEDSGGSSASATGQGMAESALSTKGSLVVGEDGSYKLNFTMSLIDYTSKRSFWVQKAGDSDWSKVSAKETATGKDSNGTTKTYQIQVPGESCIAKVSMYVDPMGRNVIFYFYPSDYTAASGSDSSEQQTDKNSSTSSDTSNSGSSADGTSNNKTSDGADGTTVNEARGATDEATADGTEGTTANGADGTTTDGTGSAAASESADGAVSGGTNSGTVSESASDASSEALTDEVLGQGSGLSLSTESEAAASLQSTQSSQSSSHPYLFLFLTIVCSGAMLILMGVLAVYYCRRNWKKWGGTYEDDDEI